MLYLIEIERIADKPVHNARQPDAEFLDGIEPVDFLYVVGVEKKYLADIGARVDGCP